MTDEQVMNAFRGALFISVVITIATVILVYGLAENTWLSIGIGLMVWVVSFLYLFGEAIDA